MTILAVSSEPRASRKTHEGGELYLVGQGRLQIWVEIQQALEKLVGIVPEEKWGKDILGQEHSSDKGKESGKRA